MRNLFKRTYKLLINIMWTASMPPWRGSAADMSHATRNPEEQMHQFIYLLYSLVMWVIGIAETHAKSTQLVQMKCGAGSRVWWVWRGVWVA